jgi:hypothetical protein
MLRFFAVVMGILGTTLGGAMAWQHRRYLGARRDIVQDRQSLRYASGHFHVVTFLELATGQNVVEGVRALRSQLQASGVAKVIYAGQAAFTMESRQLGPRSWDAVILVEYDSRQAYDTERVSVPYRDALAAFARTYSHGMRRSWLLNFMFPQVLLGLRALDVLQGKGNVGEFERAGPLERSERLAGAADRVESLRSLSAVNDEAMVVVNLIRNGDSAQRKADRAYGRRMLTRFAALAHGPMHIGSAVRLEEEAEFDQVVIVYYPGPNYFADMLESRFFNAIIDDKQLADTQAVPTVPIMSLL